jgi:hypothetical protein
LATRTSTTLAFSGLQIVATVNGTANDADVYILPTGNVLYFASDRGGNYGLYRSSKTGSAFSTPTLVSGVNIDSVNTEGNPVVTPDELTLFFASDRSGGLGSLDIYEATRPTVADGFGAPLALTSLNSTLIDVPNWIARMVERFPALIADLHGVRWPTTLPAVIVSAATPPFPDPDLQAAWRASHQGLAHTPGATQVFAEHSDHDIAEAEPDVVVGMVQRVLAVH